MTSQEDDKQMLLNLQAHQEELKLQNEELRRAQEELSIATERYFDLYDLAPVGYLTVNPDGLVVQANLKAATMLGVVRTALNRRPVTKLILPEDQDIYHLARKELQETGEPQSVELRLLRHDGTDFWGRIAATVARDSDGGSEFRLVISDITKRKHAEIALRESEEFQRDILNSLPAHIVVLDEDGKILEVNEPWLRFARENGDPPVEVVGIGANYLKVCQPACDEGDSHAQAAVDGVKLVLSGAKARFTMEYPCDGPDSPRWFALEVFRPAGKIGGAIVAHTDITSRKQAEEALRLANQELRLHFEQTPMAVIEWGLDFQVKRWNPAAEAIFGYSPEEAGGRSSEFIVPERFHKQVDGVWKSLLKQTGGRRSTNWNVRKDGTEILCEWYNTPLIDDCGTCIGVASLVLDETVRMRVQQLLEWEKDALEWIVGPGSLSETLDGLMLDLEKQSPGMLCSVFLLDDHGDNLRLGAAPSLPVDFNRSLADLMSSPEAENSDFAEHLAQTVIIEDIEKVLECGDFCQLMVRHDLHACWSTPIIGDGGKALGVFGIYHSQPRKPRATELDLIARAGRITRIAIERKTAEEKIRKFNSELEQRVLERTRELQDANALLEDFKAALDEHALVTITDSNGIITYANDKFCAISKYRREELVGQDHSIVNSGHHPKTYIRKLWNTVTRGRVWKGEMKNRAKDGSFYWVDTTIVPFLGYGGAPSQFVAIRTDITERKAAENVINKLNADLRRRAADLENANRELEAFSYSVSHDLRAPLRAVDGFSRILATDYTSRLDEGGQRIIGVIRGETQRMGKLIDDLLAFSRLGREPIDPKPIDMHLLARQVFDELAARDPSRELRLDLHDLPAAHGAESMIRLAWVNLISNAIKFTKGRDVGLIEIGANDGGKSGPIYYITDNGAGFDMRYSDKLFGVFQRLHSQEEFPGTGVGLALVQRIVQRHGGRIWVEAEPDHGATFFFTLLK